MAFLQGLGIPAASSLGGLGGLYTKEELQGPVQDRTGAPSQLTITKKLLRSRLFLSQGMLCFGNELLILEVFLPQQRRLENSGN